MPRSTYNATVLVTKLDDQDRERIVSVSVAAVDEGGYMLRGNGLQFTGWEETRLYHEHWLKMADRLHGSYGLYYVPGTSAYGRLALKRDQPIPANAVEPVSWQRAQYDLTH